MVFDHREKVRFPLCFDCYNSIIYESENKDPISFGSDAFAARFEIPKDLAIYITSVSESVSEKAEIDDSNCACGYCQNMRSLRSRGLLSYKREFGVEQDNITPQMAASRMLKVAEMVAPGIVAFVEAENSAITPAAIAAR